MCDISYLKLRLKNELEKVDYDYKKLLICESSWYYFEMFSAVYYNAHMWKDVPIDKKEELGLPIYDTGIDCATEEVAIQCKFREKCKRISWDEIAKFLASSKLGNSPYKRSILVINDSNIAVSGIRKDMYDTKILNDKDYENITDELKSFVYEIDEKYTNLRYYQKDALKVIAKGKGDIIIKMACGTGKTLVMFHYIHKYFEMYKDKKVCIFVPSLLLMRQTEEWAKIYGIVDYCLVGSNYNRKIKYDKKLYICVYNSVSYIENIVFDRVFIDEAHHIIKPDIYYDNEINVNIPISKKINEITSKKKIYMSATIDGYDYEYSMRKAIYDKCICDYDITVCKYEKFFSFKNIAQFIKEHPNFNYVLAYVNTIENAEKLSCELNKLCIMTSFFSSKTPLKIREDIIKKFESGHYRVIVTVNTLGEGINIKNASTCLFAEPRYSIINVIQCVGRIQRLSEIKNNLVHIILPVYDDSFLTKFLRIMSTNDLKIVSSIKGSFGRINVLNMDNIHCGVLSEINLYDSYGTCIFSNWDINLSKLKDYVGKCGSLPSQRNKNIELSRLSSWFSVQKSNYYNNIGTMKNNEERKRKMKEFIEKNRDLLISSDEKWKKTLTKVASYIDNNEKLPSKHDNNKSTQLLGYWVCLQKNKYKNRLLTNEKKILWKEMSKKYDVLVESNVTLWKSNLNNTIKYINEYKKRPSVADKNIEIKKLGGWINKQKNNYMNDKAIMRDSNIRKEWEKFVEKYKNLFTPLKVSNATKFNMYL